MLYSESLVGLELLKVIPYLSIITIIIYFYINQLLLSVYSMQYNILNENTKINIMLYFIIIFTDFDTVLWHEANTENYRYNKEMNYIHILIRHVVTFRGHF